MMGGGWKISAVCASFILACLVMNSEVRALGSEGPPLPDLPVQFTVTVERNMRERNESYFEKEYIDEPRDMLRVETFSEGQSAVALLRYANETGYWWFPHNLTCVPINMTNERDPFRTETGRMRSASELFFFGEDYNETYVGQERARGILCDVWMSNFTMESHRHPEFIVEFELDYFFAVDEWKIIGLDEHRVPIRVNMVGEVYNKTSMSSGSVYHFDHSLEYVDFDVEVPESSLFEAPYYCFEDCMTNCNSHGTCVNGKCVCFSGWSGRMCELEDSSSDGDDKGINRMVVLLLIAGGVIAAIVITAVACRAVRNREMAKYRRLELGSGSAPAADLDAGGVDLEEDDQEGSGRLGGSRGEL